MKKLHIIFKTSIQYEYIKIQNSLGCKLYNLLTESLFLKNNSSILHKILKNCNFIKIVINLQKF